MPINLEVYSQGVVDVMEHHIEFKMKRISVLIIMLAAFLACNPKKELNYIAFNVPKDEMIDSLKVATELLNKLDYGNGAACFVVDGHLHFSRKESGYNVIELPDQNSPKLPVIEPFDQINSIRLLKMILFLNKNCIYGMSKRADGLFYFEYKQNNFNPQNNFNDSRFIIYISEDKDTLAKVSNPQIILDRYKNIILVAPDTYKAEKLNMDKESIMKRAKELTDKQQKNIN
jgi:hypothetical protein